MHGLTNLKERYKWKQVDFTWPSNEVKELATQKGDFIPANNLPLGIERWNNKLFITVPRWRNGVGATLNYIDLDDSNYGESPLLIPYPGWEQNKLARNANRTETETDTDDDSLISVFRVRADECDRLWVMDTGVNDIWGEFEIIAPPSIVIFDLKTDKLIRRFTLPKDNVKENTFFANIVVDTTAESCNDAHAYIPDLGSYAVVVYSLKQNKSWRIKHHYFHFDPLQGNYTVGGINFQWTDGVFALALDKFNEDGSRNVYFHAFSSTKEFMVNNKVLQNETYALSEASFGDYHLLGDRGTNSQSSAEFYDAQTGVLFYTMVNRDAIGCWNTKKPLSPETQGMVESDSNALIFPNDLKVDSEGNLWVLSDKLPNFLYDKLPDDDNYRVLTAQTEELVKGTPCSN